MMTAMAIRILQKIIVNNHNTCGTIFEETDDCDVVRAVETLLSSPLTLTVLLMSYIFMHE